MSRVGKLPVKVPESVNVSVNNDIINVEHSNFKGVYQLSNGVEAKFENNEIKLFAKDKSIPKISMFVGMNRSNLNNLISGLVNPFKVNLEFNGVGYKAAVIKNLLILSLGYSHDIFYGLPDGVTAEFQKPNLIVLTGNDKSLVGQVSSEIISFRKTEPYKGKGIKIAGSKILRKEGKKK